MADTAFDLPPCPNLPMLCHGLTWSLELRSSGSGA